jgi:hypothetical protein
MKNDARFLFCFTGFVGFLLFYLIASLIHKNFAISLVHGTIGCLTFAIYGRFLLGILLKSSLTNNPSTITAKHAPTPQVDKQAYRSRNSLPKSISRKGSTMTSQADKPMVDEKV